MGLFKIDWEAWKAEKKKLNQTIGYDLRDQLRERLKGIKSYYDDDLTKQVNYYLEDNVVGSKEWPAAVINQGRSAGEWPNIDNIRQWVRKTKSGGKHRNDPDHVVNQIAYKVAKKIKDKGITPQWYVDAVLNSQDKNI